MKIVYQFALCLFASTSLIVTPCVAETWVYNDEKGTVYTADSVNNIPEQYRLNAGKLPEVKKKTFNRVQLYMKPTCPYCKQLIEQLDERKVPYKMYDISSDIQAYKRFQSLGGTGVPLTLIDGNIIVRGKDIEKIVAELSR